MLEHHCEKLDNNKSISIVKLDLGSEWILQVDTTTKEVIFTNYSKIIACPFCGVKL